MRRRRAVRIVMQVFDLLMAAASFPIAIALRVEDVTTPGLGLWGLVVAVVGYTALAALVFRVRPSRAMWRYTSTRDLLLVIENVTILQLLFLVSAFFLTRLSGMPRSVFFIQWMVLIALMVGPRVVYRLVREGQLGGWTSSRVEVAADRVPALLAGSGDEAEMFIRAVRRDRSFGFELVGLLEAEAVPLGVEIHGVPVVGHLADDLTSVVTSLEAVGRRPRKLLVASQRVDGALIRKMLDDAERLGLSVARIADPKELQSGQQAAGLQVKPIAVEDLLNRPQAALDYDQIRGLLFGRRVLVTGAGGSIGSELVRQVCGLGPACMVLVDAGEHNLYRIEHEVGTRWPQLRREACIANVRDGVVLDRLFTQYRPQVVFHAAALKHVPLVEHNPSEGVLTNVRGSRNVADLCVKHGVETMVMVSTDKAVNPTNVMGATKRLAERYCLAQDLRRGDDGHRTRFVTVRFGNVLGSSGSVVPLFERQLRAGGPLTVTHPDIVRYFMTIREAVQLILQAGALPEAGDDQAKLFVLDMGEPVKILDLARQMIRLAGLVPDRDVEIRFTGLRPGEKLFEELFYDAEDLLPTQVGSIRRASQPKVDLSSLQEGLDELLALAEGGEGEVVRQRLALLVPEYRLDPPARRDGD